MLEPAIANKGSGIHHTATVLSHVDGFCPGHMNYAGGGYFLDVPSFLKMDTNYTYIWLGMPLSRNLCPT
jgi:hypothetical protein